MDIRHATVDDVETIRQISRDSLRSSYTDFLEETTIEQAVEQWYGETFEAAVDAEHTLLLIIERDGEPVGFSQSELVGQQFNTGQIQWLHVDPEHRGAGTGVRLLVMTRETLLEEGADQIQGFVLEGNEVGNEFYRNNGFEHAGQEEVEVGGETFTENVYVEGSSVDGGWGAVDALEIDGESVYVSYGESSRGSSAPFYAAYHTEDRTERYGWLCGKCDTIDNAMDSMGRIECNTCGNRRKATRWDASYL